MNEDGTSAFGRLLLWYRRATGMSQAELARVSGMSVRALRELERGRARAAQQRSTEALAEGLGLSGDEREEFLTTAQVYRRRGVSHGAEFLETSSLPPRVTDLVGRRDELERFHAEADAGGVVVLAGPPGVGKTALALTAADELAARFPDGCLAVDLRGMDEQPLPARAALERLLRALDVPAARVPAAEAEQSSLLRSLLRGRRVLLLLDNAADEAQVRPLLTVGRGCLTVVTCRHALAGLDGARWMRLEPLEGADAVGLLAAIAGADRIAVEPQAAAELAELCGNLPLAVRIVGNRLATRPRWSLDHQVKLLTDERTRLRSLAAGDLQMRSAFEMSYHRLARSAQAVFRRLAALPGADFGAELAAVATGVPAADVHAHLDELADASLLQTTSVPGRFQFHDLIRIFAAERHEAEEPRQERERLRDALLDHILDTATAAAGLFFPNVLHSGSFASRAAAAEWLEQEGTNWVAAQRAAAGLGRHRQVVDLAEAMHWYSDSRVYQRPWEQVFRLGAEAARALGSRRDEAVLLNFLGWAQYVCLDRNEEGLATHGEALSIAVEVGDRHEQAWAHAYMSMELLRLGRPSEALSHSREAAAISAEFEFFDIQMSARNGLGRVLHALGRYEEALEVHRALLDHMDRYGAETNKEVLRLLEGTTLENVGNCLAGLGEWRAAGKTYREARALQGAGGLEHADARIALSEGAVWREAGEYACARECLESALASFEGSFDRSSRERALAELALLPEGG
ncbi:ATP-binding protein [Streptomonospora salina]|uniref:Tetratricopeptide (TPR) repeat protein/transcriptional regulator with XRE-family HTH domain n=1 Tax=Streptomonospora salina TaxID=104205 RepID=A0A841EAM4_9ACTN|nr:XRE family transcriptional regulator [Streptomonospora salina]MBB5998379.1 tetratricopeptide (TPR) repeat protein/transcriptional regulator with XRE-family HTH domain [Streptomonospora salina]